MQATSIHIFKDVPTCLATDLPSIVRRAQILGFQRYKATTAYKSRNLIAHGCARAPRLRDEGLQNRQKHGQCGAIQNSQREHWPQLCCEPLLRCLKHQRKETRSLQAPSSYMPSGARPETPYVGQVSLAERCRVPTSRYRPQRACERLVQRTSLPKRETFRSSFLEAPLSTRLPQIGPVTAQATPCHPAQSSGPHVLLHLLCFLPT